MSTFIQLALTQIWQIVAVTLAVALVVRVGCRRRPHLAYLLWMIVIAKCLTPPVWSSPTSLFSWATMSRATTEGTQLPGTVSAQEAPASDFIAQGAGGAPPQTLASNSELTNRSQTWSFPMAMSALALVWLAGSLVLAAIFFGNGIRIIRRLKRTALPLEPTWLEQLDACGRQLGLRRTVRLVVTLEPLGPAVYGVVRPVIVLPHSVAEQETPGALASILSHELIHIRRGDPLIALVQVLAQCVWWFHPCVWWANKQANRERERACDEELLATTRLDPADYAQCLLDVLRTKQTLRSIAGFPGVRAVEVTKRRLEHILRPETSFHRRTPTWCWAIGFVLALVALPGAGVALNSRSEASGVTQANNEPPKAASNEIVVNKNFFVIPLRTKLQQLLAAQGNSVQVLVEVNGYALVGKRGDDLLRALDVPSLKRTLASVQAHDPNASVIFVTDYFGEASEETRKLADKDEPVLERLYVSIAKDAKLSVGRPRATWINDSSGDRWQMTVDFLKGIDFAKETFAETGVGDRDVTAYPVQSKISQLLTAGFNFSRFTVADCVLYVHRPLKADDHPMLGPDLQAKIEQSVSKLKLPNKGRIDYHLFAAFPAQQKQNWDALRDRFYPDEAPRLTKLLGFKHYSMTTQ